jgi:hypothetical protein
MFGKHQISGDSRKAVALATLAAAVATTLAVPVVASADTITGGTFTLSTGSGPTDTISGGSLTLYGLRGSSSTVNCGSRLQQLSVFMPTDLSDAPAAAQWEYWTGDLVMNPQIVYAPDGQTLLAQGGQHVTWTMLFARNLATGQQYYSQNGGSTWSGSSIWYQSFSHTLGNTYAIHDWVYYRMSNGSSTNWIDEGYRSANAYQGTLHILSNPDCIG